MRGDRALRRRPAAPLSVALLLGLCAFLAPALFSAGSPRATSPATAEMAMTGVACPLLRPGPPPRLDVAESKPLPPAALPTAVAARGGVPGWSTTVAAGATRVALGRFTRDCRAPPYARRSRT